MKIRSKLIVAASVATIAGLAAAVQVRAGGDRVAFPENYAKGVRYLTLEKQDSRDVRDYYTSPEAAEAAKKGAPLPDGTVITVVLYAAQLDGQGNLTKDPNGRLIRTDPPIGDHLVVQIIRLGPGSEGGSRPTADGLLR